MSGKARRSPLAGLLGAVGVSVLGTRMSLLALPWLVLTTTGSATKTGLVAFAEMAPYVAVQALGGPVIDRLGARAASVGTDLIAAVFLGAVPLLWAWHLLPLGGLAGLVAIAGASRGAGDAARDVLLPGVSDLAGSRIERASGLYDGVNRLAALAGVPLAGMLVAVIAPADVLAIDAATFAASAGLVALLVPLTAQPAPEQRGGNSAPYLSSLAEGFGHLRRDRLLVAIAVMVLVTNFLDQAGGAVLTPVWAHDILHSPIALGLVSGAVSLGAVTGNAAITWLAPRLPRRMTYAAGFLLAGAPRYLAMALFGSLSPVLAVVFLSGLGAGGINPILGAVLYERVPRRLQARVLGTVNASAWAGTPFGSLAAGLTVSSLGLHTALLTTAAIYALATLPPFLFPVWRQMAPTPHPPPSTKQPSHITRTEPTASHPYASNLSQPAAQPPSSRATHDQQSAHPSR
jgi:Major Facilitator Superfamily